MIERIVSFGGDILIDVNKITVFNCPSQCCNDYETCLEVDPYRCYRRLEDFYKYKGKSITKQNDMTGKEYLHTISREKLESLIMNYCCPNCIDVETVLSMDNDFCNDSCVGDCQRCWGSNVIGNK